MKKLLLITLIASGSLFAPQGYGQSASLQFSPAGGSYAPGSNITFSINLIVTTGGTLNNVQGLTYFFQDLNAGPFYFTITARDLTGSPFNDAINNSPPGAFQADALDPANDRDLGALSDASMASGNYFVAMLTFSTGSAPPGTYTIQSIAGGQPNKSVVFDSQGDAFDIAASSFTFTIIPEPGTFALLGIGAIAGGVFGWRRRRG